VLKAPAFTTLRQMAHGIACDFRVLAVRHQETTLTSEGYQR
jgi:hypothetical protein